MKRQRNVLGNIVIVLGLIPMLALAQTNANKVEEMAKTASQGVGDVSQTGSGKTGAPIIVLEEVHNSRVGQIEHAITLIRLHQQFGLRHIGLEGYLKNKPKIDTGWFFKTAKGLSITSRNRVAVRMLREGEISGVELMALLFPDVTICPIELEKDNALQLSKEASYAPFLYLLKIAQLSLSEEHVPTLQRIQTEMKGLESQKEGEAYQKKVKEMYDYVLSADPWAQTKSKRLQDLGEIKSMSGEEHLKDIQEIEDQARKLKVAFEPEEQKAMRDYVAFQQSRINSNKTMIGAITPIADQSGVTLVAMNIGAWHTKSMCAMLAAGSRSYAVVTPRSLENNETKGDIGSDVFLNNKYKATSIYSDPGLTETILRVFPRGGMKPPPTLTEGWLQAKSEVYLITQKIAEGLFGPLDIPNGGAPPFGFSDDEFKGKWVFVDPRKIELVDEPGAYRAKAAIFPIVLIAQDENKKQTLWAKAVLTGPVRTQEDIVAMLLKARTEVQAEGDPKMKEVVSDKTGKKATAVPITLNSVGIYAGEKTTVQSIRAI